MNAYVAKYCMFIAFIAIIQSETITINPGDDIQSAIDSLHKNGNPSTLIFNKGTYTINKSLIIYSDLTLQGNSSNSASDIIIRVDPNNLKYNEPILTSSDNSNAKLSNINIINLSLLGNIQPSEQKYPNYCLQCIQNCTGKTSSDPGCECLNQCPLTMRSNQLGILFMGDGTDISTAQNVNILLKDLEVSHCAMGIHIKGTRQLNINGLDLFENGMIQTYFHNMYLRRTFNVTIERMKSHDSPTGNGINISQSSYIVAFLSIFENNYWRGLRIEGEENYVFHNINVYNNTCDGDGDYGFRFANGENGIVQNNVAKNNTPTNCYKSNLKNVTFINNHGF